MTTPRETVEDQLAQSEARQRDLESRLAALPPSASAARTLTESLLASERQLQQRLSAIRDTARPRARRGLAARPVTWQGLAVVAAAATAGWLVRSWLRR